MRTRLFLAFALAGILSPQFAHGAERTEYYDIDPRWEAVNNRSTAFSPKEITQQFGYSRTQHAGGKQLGEMGGIVTPAGEAAYYAKVIPKSTFDNKLTASGTLACPGKRPFHTLIGFFNADTTNEWRTPNTIAIRIQGRGDVFFAYVEYTTSRWRAGADHPRGFTTDANPQTGRLEMRGFNADGQVHKWSISYDPKANDGHGSIMVSIDDQRAVCHVSPEHRLDGATFNRCGLLNVMKQWDSPGELWLDDVVVNGEVEDFASDPGWDAKGNNRTYVSGNVRPRFDFGYSRTNFAGGKKVGELGGLMFRGDIRDPDRMGSYGDRIEKLTLIKPMRASGTVSLRRGVSDSGTYIGFFNSKESLETNPSQASAIPRSFLGIAVTGPSSEGFFMCPAFRDSHDNNGSSITGPRILPNGEVHSWDFDYQPAQTGEGGEITVMLGDESTRMRLPTKVASTDFDRFGLVTAWVDGNGQHIYFDDLTYTYNQKN